MKVFWALLLLSLCFVAGPSEGWSKECSLSLDLMGASASTKALPTKTGSLGFSLFGDWRPDRLISFGVGAGYLNLGNWDLSAAWVDLGGRLYPLKPFSFGETYLQASAGWNPLVNSEKGWRGNYHAAFGVGLRCGLRGNRSLDVGIVSDVFSPQAKPLQTIGLKAGLCWTFGKEKNGSRQKSRRETFDRQNDATEGRSGSRGGTVCDRNPNPHGGFIRSRRRHPYLGGGGQSQGDLQNRLWVRLPLSDHRGREHRSFAPSLPIGAGSGFDDTAEPLECG